MKPVSWAASRTWLPSLVDDPRAAHVVDERPAVLLEDQLLAELEAARSSGYSPCPLPAHVPSSQASRAQFGWMFSGISNGMRVSAPGSRSVGSIVFFMRRSADQRHHSDAQHGRRQHHDEEGFHDGQS